MKIERVEAVPVAASFRTTFRFGTVDRSTSPNVVVIIRTDDGVVGYGEACPVPAFTSETQRSVVELVEERVAPLLVGRDPRHRVPVLQELAQVLRFAPFTTAAVDTALLDLVGRALGVPVHTLLGGAFRDRVEVHGSVGWSDDHAEVVRNARAQAQTYRGTRIHRQVIILSGIIPLLPGLTAYRGFYQLASAQPQDVVDGLVTVTLALAIGLALAAGVTLGQFVARPRPAPDVSQPDTKRTRRRQA